MQQTNKRCLDDESGATAIEYSLIAGMVSIAAAAIFPVVGTGIINTFSVIAAAF